ncbi:hypothetical protein [Mycolicibacterium pulveris]|uniref:hypothetical protein n=1 Tax=Mycolicibacterium pulveris TaxID=36813 RepID=UPI003CE68FAB
MEPSRLDLARMNVQRVTQEYDVAKRSMLGDDRSDPHALLMTLSEALVLVINELDDLRKGR